MTTKPEDILIEACFLAENIPNEQIGFINNSHKWFLERAIDILFEAYFLAENIPNKQIGFIDNLHKLFIERAIDANGYSEQEAELAWHSKKIQKLIQKCSSP